MTDPAQSREFHQRISAHRLPLKSIPRRLGELYLDRYLPDLSDDEREYMLQLCGQKMAAPLQAEPKDPVFIAAMYMAGVSQGDLAALYGVRKQTIQSKIYNHTSKVERSTMRERPTTVDLEAVTVAREMYYIMCRNNPTLNEMTATELGRMLLNAANARVAEDRGDDPTPKRPRRYANVNISTLPKEGRDLAKEFVQAAAETQTSEDAIEMLAEGERVVDEKYPPPNTVRADEQAYLDSLLEE